MDIAERRAIASVLSLSATGTAVAVNPFAEDCGFEVVVAGGPAWLPVLGMDAGLLGVDAVRSSVDNSRPGMLV